jgi:hypothetical protein
MPLNPEENGIGRYTATATGDVDTTVADRAFHDTGNSAAPMLVLWRFGSACGGVMRLTSSSW